MIEINKHIQFWDRSETKPSTKDILLTMKLMLDMLEQSLPIALEAIGTKSVDDQMSFWLAFDAIETETDLTEYEYKRSEMCNKLSYWSEVCSEMTELNKEQYAAWTKVNRAQKPE